MTIVEFLTARLDEDEAVARYATTRGAPTDEDFAGWWIGHYDHANSHAPSRVLADCEAKRGVVGLLRADAIDPRNAVRRELAVELLTQMAAVYSDHEDFQEEWRP